MATRRKEVAGLALRQQAAQRLAEVLKGASFAPFSVAEIAEGRDRALANRLVTTALRYNGPITKLIGQLLERGLPKKSGAFEAVLRLSLAQLLFLPELGDHSALFLAGEAMRADPKGQHLLKLMNGVLREAQRRRDGVATTADDLFPPKLLETWRSAYGDAAVDQFAAAYLADPPLDLTVKSPEPAFVEAVGGEVVLGDTVRVALRDRPVDQLPGFADGQFWVQDVAAAIPARLFGLPPGASVLDIGAAPGGKTAQLCKAGFDVTALDRDPQRMERLRSNLQRLGYTAEIVVADALAYQPERQFDGVLLDAPCSATGTFRRHPEVVWHRTEADIGSRAALQRQLLEKSAALLRPGGVLVYAVCSLEPEEGEQQASWMASQGLEPLPITAEELDGWDYPLNRQGFVRTHPALPLPQTIAGALDGFFVARFRRP